MNLQLCYSDAYAREIEARVVAVEGAEAPLVVLDSTVFYPGGGGQPSDRGILLRAADGRTWTVAAARKSGGEIVHELEAGVEPPDRTSVHRLRTVEMELAPPLAGAKVSPAEGVPWTPRLEPINGWCVMA